ncbi:MAG TPA: arylamine N-acetyltransferase, partial [Fimbriimonas sp.]|nr:arylamine N-acetyltransferase [Fimbriimonas sp.]
ILDPAEFFESWLSNGTGGTCWAHGNALYSFLKALGFDVHRAAASMYDFGQPNHATAIVNFEDGSRWIVDNSLLTMEPLNIEPASPSQLSEGVHYAEVEYDGDTLYVHGTAPPMPHIFFRLLEPEVPESFYEERYEASRGFSPFNERIHICRKTEESIWAMRGGNLFHVTVEGIQHQPLESEGIKRHLIETFGMSPDYVEQWAASGAMESSLKSESAMPDLPVRIPPSKQGM